MARKDDNQHKVYRIPMNYEEKSVTISGLSYRNIAEAVVLVGIIVAVLWFIPKDAMSLKVKIMLGLIIGGPLGVLGVVGINSCSLTEYLMYVINFKLRPPIYKRKNCFSNDETKK